MMRRLAALACALLIASGVQAQAIEMRTVEGVLHVVWGDPQESALGTAAITSASPRYRAFITTDAGESIELDPILSRDLTAGDLVSLNGRRVRASGTAAAQRATPLGGGLAPFHALSIQPATALGNAAFSAAPDWPVQQRPYAIILCKFNDVPDEPLPVSRYEAMYADSFGGADDFYREVSDGRINIQGTRIYGWYTLPRARSAYVINDQANLNSLFNDCTRQADPDVDFKQVVGMAMHFNAFLDCCSWGGSRTATLDGVTKTFATMWNASWARSGTSWHEMGHSIGLPHSGGPYGRTYDSVWDVMSASTSGRYLNQDFGFGGAHFIGYHKNLLGLIPAGRRVTVTSGEWRGVVEAHARNANGSGTVLVMVPVADPARFGQAYTLELRGKTGYDVRIPRAALIIHSIVPGRAEPARIVDGDGDGDPNDDGATWTVGETFSDPSAGIEIQIDSLTASGVAVTVRNGAGRGATLAIGGATFARAYGDATLLRDSVRVNGTSAWRAASRRSWLKFVRQSGNDGDYLTYSADVGTLAPGRYADTVRVHATAEKQPSVAAPYVIEVIISPATDVAALSVIARRDSARTSVTSNVDSTFLSLQGRYAGSSWTAMRSSQRLFIGSRLANGNLVVDLTTTEINSVGSRWLYFRRGPESSAGRTVDTLTVTIADATPITLRMVDTLDAFAPIYGSRARADSTASCRVR
jgi:M6 family metalloprotease-like protein